MDLKNQALFAPMGLNVFFTPHFFSMPADSVKQEPEAPHNLKDCKEGAENGKKTADNLPNTSQSQCNLFWDLRRKVADIVTEFEYTTREVRLVI